MIVHMQVSALMVCATAILVLKAETVQPRFAPTVAQVTEFAHTITSPASVMMDGQDMTVL